jgi:LysR family glycine cleavage system transcriptional activator
MRRLPSLDTLRAFEAAARLLSFTKASAELNVTQSALSQRIAALEAELGYKLFQRDGRRLSLTQRGEVIATAMARALGEITRAFQSLAKGSADHSIVLSVLPSFASRWLLQRLPRFHAEFPKIQVQVIAEGRLIDLNTSEADLAVRFGTGQYPGLAITFVMDDHVVPVCHPRLLEGRPAVTKPADILGLPLLHDTAVERDQSGTDWRTYFKFVGVTAPSALEGQRFNQADLMLQAAARGLGLALARRSLIQDDLDTGQLAVAFPQTMAARYGYYLVSLPTVAERRAVASFRDWLAREAAAFMAAR